MGKAKAGARTILLVLEVGYYFKRLAARLTTLCNLWFPQVVLLTANICCPTSMRAIALIMFLEVRWASSNFAPANSTGAYYGSCDRHQELFLDIPTVQLASFKVLSHLCPYQCILDLRLQLPPVHSPTLIGNHPSILAHNPLYPVHHHIDSYLEPLDRQAFP